jgi:hypothetical protein
MRRDFHNANGPFIIGSAMSKQIVHRNFLALTNIPSETPNTRYSAHAITSITAS